MGVDYAVQKWCSYEIDLNCSFTSSGCVPDPLQGPIPDAWKERLQLPKAVDSN